MELMIGIGVTVAVITMALRWSIELQKRFNHDYIDRQIGISK
jgi:hypothetical protein